MSPTGGDKPYRVYRGGRVKGKVPSLARDSRIGGPDRDGRFRLRSGRKGPDRGPGPVVVRKKRRWGRWILTTVGVLVLLVIIWGVASYFSFRSGVEAANKRVPASVKKSLAPGSGWLMGHPTNILLMGTDHSKNKSRASDRHSDSITLVHTDPSSHRVVYVSIMRDLRVEVPGYGTQKVNAGNEFGGPKLEIKTIEDNFHIPINHIVLVDFNQFKSLIDTLGGIDVNVPRPILSNPFDCPYDAQKCATWKGWRFSKGWHHLDGRKALVYSRIRENQLDPRSTDATRVLRQQQVQQAIASKLTSPWTVFQMPFIGGDLMKPVGTDLSAGQLVQLAWVKFRAGTAWHCRIGGTADGSGYIQQDEQAFLVRAFLNDKREAPQPPLKGSLFGSGCVHGTWPANQLY
jgi:LCP family protein required for cell wall assembly